MMASHEYHSKQTNVAIATTMSVSCRNDETTLVQYLVSKRFFRLFPRVIFVLTRNQGKGPGETVIAS